jgi:hypothetical protein
MRLSILGVTLATWMVTSCGFPGGGINGNCPSGTYIGDLGGLPATVRLTAETLPVVETVSGSSSTSIGAVGEYLLVGGEISSQTAYYTFTAEFYGPRGFGDVLDHGTNQRFRAQFDLTENGFIFTANPFEGGGTTSYYFTCQ